MKKKIYVGCYSRNVKSTDWGSHLYDYLPITVFIERARRENLEIHSYQDISSQEKMWRCNHVYEIVFKYKFRERKHCDPLIPKGISFLLNNFDKLSINRLYG